MLAGTLLYETDTEYGHYQVWDTVYGGRPARVLYSGQRQAAQSGIAYDENTDLLFDYNQRLYELICGLQPRHVLVIGGGAYTLPTRLITSLPTIRVDVVELDPGLESIARHYFDLPSDVRLNIHSGDGLQYLRDHSETYDVIIIDAFTHTTMPEALFTSQALALYGQRLQPHGLLAVNCIAAYHGHRSTKFHELLTSFGAAFTAVSVFPAGHDRSLWLPQNLVVVAQTGKPKDLSKLMRYPELTADKARFSLRRDLGIG